LAAEKKTRKSRPAPHPKQLAAQSDAGPSMADEVVADILDSPEPYDPEPEDR
jgi:hypothetical protein